MSQAETQGAGRSTEEFFLDPLEGRAGKRRRKETKQVSVVSKMAADRNFRQHDK